MSASDPLSITKGTLDVLVLRALTWAPMHGVEIIGWIEDQSGHELEIDDSGVYQALYRMEQRGLVDASWGFTENSRRARYYAISKAGRVHLRVEAARWIRYSGIVTSLLGLDPPVRARGAQ